MFLTPPQIEQAHKAERQLVILYENILREYGETVGRAGLKYFERRVREERVNDERTKKTGPSS